MMEPRSRNDFLGREAFVDVVIGEDDEFEAVENSALSQPLYVRKPRSHDKEVKLEEVNHHFLKFVEFEKGELYNDQNLSGVLSISNSEEESNKKHWISQLSTMKRDFTKATNDTPFTTNNLTITAEELGGVLAAAMLGCIAIGAIFNETLVAPVLGWIGVILGLGFVLMGRVASRRG